MRTILGIDPGLATIGLGVIEATSPQEMRALDWCTITTESALGLPERLGEIEQDLEMYIEEYKPEIAVIEQLYFSVNEKTALLVAQARGVILSTVGAKQIPIIEPTPPQLKSAITGDGSADKQQMQEMVQRILNLDEIPQPDDAADALALAVYGSLQHQSFMTHA